MDLTEEVKRNQALVLTVAVILFATLWAGIGIFDESVKAQMDRGNWDTAVSLDLPVNVTRVILPGSTMFTYAPRGDEKAVFYIFKDDHVQSEQYNVSFHDLARRDGPLLSNAWPPAVELKVIRENGTTEEYQLPTRDTVKV